MDVPRRKRVHVRGAGAVSLVGALAEAFGFEVTGDPGDVDLAVTGASPAEVAEASRVAPRTLAVADRKLRSAETRALEDAGAQAIVDGDASLLDAAVVLSSLLFESCTELKRHGRRYSTLTVRFWPSSGRNESPVAVGRFLGIARAGGFIETAHAFEEGEALALEVELQERTIPLRGKIAFAGEDALAVELAPDDLLPALRGILKRAPSRSIDPPPPVAP